jgi:hypothetical protein
MHLLVLSAIRWDSSGFDRARSLLCGALLAFALVTERAPLPRQSARRADVAGWPVEAASWRRDRSREFRVWPPGWSPKLDPARSSRVGDAP